MQLALAKIGKAKSGTVELSDSALFLQKYRRLHKKNITI